MTAGTGNIDFNANVGLTNALGLVTINSAGTIDTDGVFKAAGLTWTSTGETQLDGLVTSTAVVDLTAGLIDVNSGITARGYEVELNATTGGLTIDGGAILTTGLGNAAAGVIDINVTNGNATINSSLIARGGTATGAVGQAGGAVTIDTGAEDTVTFGTGADINTGGSAANGGDRNGGAGGAVTINTGDALITLTDTTITTSGGAKSGSGTSGVGGAVTFSDEVALAGGKVTITTGDTPGDGEWLRSLDDSGADILFSDSVATAGNDLTLDAGPLGDVTFSSSLTGEGDFKVVYANNQTYQQLDLSSIDLTSAGTVDFNGVVATTGNITVSGASLITQDASVAHALNLTYSADTITLSSDITTNGYGHSDSPREYTEGNQIYNGLLTLGSNVTLTGNTGRIYGSLDLSGYDITFRFNEPPVVPPYSSFDEMTNAIRAFSPAVQSIASVDNAGLLTNYYVSEFTTYQSESVSDIYFGDDSVFRMGDESICDSSECTEILSSSDVTITPATTASLTPSIGELSRINGPKILPIF